MTRLVSSYDFTNSVLEHEVLLDQPDLVKSVKESEIIEDDHHNVETVGTEDEQLLEDDYSPPSTTQTRTYQEGQQTVTETTDGNFYQKKVVGPGFVTVVTSSSSANVMAGSPNEAIKELVNAMLGMVG